MRHISQHVITKASYILFFRRYNESFDRCSLENLKAQSSQDDEWIQCQLPIQRPTTAAAFPRALSMRLQSSQGNQVTSSTILDSIDDIQKMPTTAPTAVKRTGTTILHLGDALNIFLKVKLQSDCLSILKKFHLMSYSYDGSGRGLKSTFDHCSSIGALCAAALSLQYQNVTPQSLCHSLAGMIESNSFEFCCASAFEGKWINASEFLKLQMTSMQVTDYTHKLKSCWKPDSDPFWIGSVEIAAFAQVYGCDVCVYSFLGGCIPATFRGRLVLDNEEEVCIRASQIVSFLCLFVPPEPRVL